MDDLISRQAALDCFHDWIDKHGDVCTPDDMPEYRAIEALPSVQPEKRTQERTETHSCDCISRQAAIDSIEKHLRFGDELYPLTDTDKVLNHGFEIAASCVYNLPSAQSDLSEYSDKLWKVAYERGKAEVQQRWIPCSDCERRCNKWENSKTSQG